MGGIEAMSLAAPWQTDTQCCAGLSVLGPAEGATRAIHPEVRKLPADLAGGGFFFGPVSDQTPAGRHQGPPGAEGGGARRIGGSSPKRSEPTGGTRPAERAASYEPFATRPGRSWPSPSNGTFTLRLSSDRMVRMATKSVSAVSCSIWGLTLMSRTTSPP